jgi:response regulator NasT
MRILIADDEGIIRMGLKRMLQEAGHEVFAATNGREALQMARSHLPDLAILDIKMPYTDGLQAAHTLSRTQPMPILLLTAYSERDLIERATDLPIHGYLIKPIKAEELEAAIAVAMKRFIEAQSLAERASQLERTLQVRKLIDRAKGRLMDAGMSEQEAYLTLQRRARDQRRSLLQVAQAVLEEG